MLMLEYAKGAFTFEAAKFSNAIREYSLAKRSFEEVLR